MSTTTIRIATLNCRNAADNWPKRAGLLLDQLVELQPHVIGLQELRHFLPAQAKFIAQAVGIRTGQAHWLHTTYKTGLLWFWEGIGILTRLPIVERDSVRLSSDHRVATFARVRVPGGGMLDVYNTHLGGSAEMKKAQAEEVLAWMATRPGVAQVLVGDFNATPRSAPMRSCHKALHSACVLANGAEPARTVPTPLRKAADPSRGVVLDYIFVNDAVEVHDAVVTFDRPGGDDPCLYASDHFGLAATISIRQ